LHLKKCSQLAMRLKSRLFFARRPVVINMRSRAPLYVTNCDD